LGSKLEEHLHGCFGVEAFAFDHAEFGNPSRSLRRGTSL
jgi:hypothetical protein